MKTALVLGAGGFIGSHMVKRLSSEGYWVRGVDLKKPEFEKSAANEFIVGDLRDKIFTERVIKFSGYSQNYHYQYRTAKEGFKSFDEIYQFAADIGGAGYLFTGEHDADIMTNSSSININLLSSLVKNNYAPKIFYSSSACVYPTYNQEDPLDPNCKEDSVFPANPDSEYGWEKLFSERLYLAYAKNYRLDVKIARYHGIFGPCGTWTGGKEKSVAAICRKIAESKDGNIEIWGDGKQTRSFLYIDECIEATRKLMESSFSGPVNIGSEYLISIDDMADLIAKIANKNINKIYVNGPTGVRGRKSDNALIKQKLAHEYLMTFEDGIKNTYEWIYNQINE